jgi:hypothetical protein
MVNTNTVAADIVATNDVLDDMIADTYAMLATEKTFLTAYKTKLASARTKVGDDARFCALFTIYYMKKMGRVS